MEVVRASPGDLREEVRAAGKIAPRLEVNVFAKLAGRARGVFADVGDVVREGQLLVKLEDDELAAQVRQAEAALAVAEANQRAAAANLEDARRNLERLEFLYSQGAVPLQQLEQARLRYAQAAAGVPEAQVAQARAALELARLQLANTEVRAPVAGVVAARFIDPGEVAAPTQPLFTIVSIDTVFLELGVTEDVVAKIREGDEVAVRVPALGRSFTGRISFAAPAADARTRQYTVKVSLPNPERLLRPGMSGEARFVVGVRRGVLRVPASAVLTRGGEAFVYVVAGGRAAARRVEPGVLAGGYREVRSGLRPGELVVVAGQDFLSDGARVVVRGVRK